MHLLCFSESFLYLIQLPKPSYLWLDTELLGKDKSQSLLKGHLLACCFLSHSVQIAALTLVEITYKTRSVCSNK